MKQYHFYIMSNASRTLYLGVTNSLERRVWEHKHKRVPGFTSRYNINRLVYSETCSNILEAIAREKQPKGGSAAKRLH